MLILELLYVVLQILKLANQIDADYKAIFFQHKNAVFQPTKVQYPLFLNGTEVLKTLEYIHYMYIIYKFFMFIFTQN